MAESNETKSRLAWIYLLRKEEALTELQRRGIPASEANKVAELRRILKEAILAEQEADEEKELSEEEKRTEIITTSKEESAMEYATQFDFKIEIDDWELFVERVEFYFETKGITDANKQRAIFLTKIDTEAYAVVRKVCAPAKPKDVTRH